MTFIEAIIMALKDIMRAKMRSFLTMLGVIIGVFAVISLVAIGEGMREFMYQQIMGFGTGPTYMEIHGGKKGEFAGMAATKLTYEDSRAIEEECKSIKSVDPQVMHSAEFTYKNKTFFAPIVMGNSEALFEMINWGVEEGRIFSEIDISVRRKVCILGKKIARKLFGNFSAVGEKVKVNGSKCLVIGVLEEKGAWLGFDMDEYAMLPVTTAMDIFKVEKLIEIAVVAKSEGQVDKAVAEIRQVLLKRHGREDFRIDTQEESLELLSTIMKMLTGIISGIAAISLIVGGIGIMNIMLVAVAERTREIGVRKAIGAKNRDILVQFLTESVIISLMGGAIGIILGVSISNIIAIAIGLPMVFSVWSILLATFVSFFVGITSGVYPAMRAARFDPVESLRYE